MGFWLHNKKYHQENQQIENNNETISNICKYCNKILANRQSKWRHEQKCKSSNNITLEEQVKKLSEEIKDIKTKPLEGTQVYIKTKNGMKDKLYGTYSSKTGKVKKVLLN